MPLKPGDRFTVECPTCGREREVRFYSRPEYQKTLTRDCRVCAQRASRQARDRCPKPENPDEDFLAPCGRVIVPAEDGRCHDYYHACEHSSECLRQTLEWTGFRFAEAVPYNYVDQYVEAV